MNISIILPTINEADNLKLLIPEIVKNLETVENLNFEIIVSDDGSTDSTKELVTEINLKHSNVHLFERTSSPSLPMFFMRLFFVGTNAVGRKPCP